MHNLLHRNFLHYFSPDPSYGEYFTLDQLNALKKSSFNGIQGVGGHMLGSFLDYEKVLGNDVLYFTMVREPINRFLSHLNWQNHIMKKEWTVEAFCAENYFHNFQCFRLSGQRSCEGAINEIHRKNFFVGVLEEYDKSLILLQHKFPVPFSVLYEHSNAKDYNHNSEIKFENLNDRQKQLVIDANEEDVKLYSYIKNVLFNSYKSNFPDLDNQLYQFRKENSNFKFRRTTLLKRKLSNKFVSLIIQKFL